MKKLVLSMAAAACLVGAMLTTAGAADEQVTVNVDGSQTTYTVSTPTKLVVSGDVTLTGTGNAFTINADTTLEFAEGASLTLTGYDNGFVVENATLSGGGWVINDGDGMDLFRLKNSGELNITGNVDLNGHGNTDTTSRAIVLPGSSSGQEVALAANTTLSANNFYRGVETGGASTYTISGMDMNTSVFDFSDNDCGMFISYFDSNVYFTQCKLEVSNCTNRGIFMRQDNAALDGLYISRVDINCVNDDDFEQGDIAIRFHSNEFAITDSVINIKNAWNTGLWICDGWNVGEKEISGTTINVDNVFPKSELYSGANRRKAITLVPVGEWLIDDCTITMNGTSENDMEGGINIASDIQINRSSLTAKPTIVGGKIKIENTEINTAYINGADVGVQVGQFLEIGKNVVIENDHNNADWKEHFTVLCDDYNNGYPGQILGISIKLNYDVSSLTDAQKSPDRLIVSGGSYWSTRDENLKYLGRNDCLFFDESVPVNENGDDLTMFTITPGAYAAYVENDVIELFDSDGMPYNYEAKTASADDNRYIWAPAVTVTFGDTGETVDVPCGTAFGLTATLPNGNWIYNNSSFTEDTIVSEDITLTVQ